MVELEYTSGLSPDAERIEGSNPSRSTKCESDGTVDMPGLEPGAWKGVGVQIPSLILI